MSKTTPKELPLPLTTARTRAAEASRRQMARFRGETLHEGGPSWEEAQRALEEERRTQRMGQKIRARIRAGRGFAQPEDLKQLNEDENTPSDLQRDDDGLW